MRWYSSEPGAPLRRRPTDAVLLVLCLLALLLLAPAAPGPTSVDQSLTALLKTMPSWLGAIVSVGYACVGIWGLLLVVVPLLTRHRRLLSVLLLLAALIAFVIAGAAGALAGTDWGHSWTALWSASSPPVYTAVRVGVVTALITAATKTSLPSLGQALKALPAYRAEVEGALRGLKTPPRKSDQKVYTWNAAAALAGLHFASDAEVDAALEEIAKELKARLKEGFTIQVK